MKQVEVLNIFQTKLFLNYFNHSEFLLRKEIKCILAFDWSSPKGAVGSRGTALKNYWVIQLPKNQHRNWKATRIKPMTSKSEVDTRTKTSKSNLVCIYCSLTHLRCIHALFCKSEILLITFIWTVEKVFIQHFYVLKQNDQFPWSLHTSQLCPYKAAGFYRGNLQSGSSTREGGSEKNTEYNREDSFPLLGSCGTSLNLSVYQW